MAAALLRSGGSALSFIAPRLGACEKFPQDFQRGKVTALVLFCNYAVRFYLASQ